MTEITIPEITIHKFKNMNLEWATIISGFPTVGLVSTIVANYLIPTLKLDQISAIDSSAFPPVSMVYAGKPKFPARIFADEKLKIVVFLSEFNFGTGLARPIANKILQWAIENKCKRIITPEGFPCEEQSEHSDLSEDLEVYAVGTTDSVREEIKNLGIKQLDTGVISGVSGVLLNEGRRQNFDVIALLADVRPNIPDARAAAKVIEIIDRLVYGLNIDVKPLYEQAENIENYLKTLKSQAKPVVPPTPIPPGMYG